MTDSPLRPPASPSVLRCAIVIDDHDLVRDGLRRMLMDTFDFAEVHAVGQIEMALDILASVTAVDLVVADLSLPGLSGTDGLAALVDAAPEARIVVVSGSERPEDILGALSTGVDGYVPKSLSVPDIVAAFRKIMDGEVFVPHRLARRGVLPAPVRDRVRRSVVGVENLTDRQREVLAELRQGKSSKAMARTLLVTEGTIKIHLAAIYRALGVRTRGEVLAKLMGQD